MWQDILITTGGFILIASLICSVRLKDRWYIPNCLILGGVLFAYGIAFGTMSMWLSASVMFAQAGLWTTLGVQKWRQQDGLSGASTPPSTTLYLTEEQKEQMVEGYQLMDKLDDTGWDKPHWWRDSRVCKNCKHYVGSDNILAPNYCQRTMATHFDWDVACKEFNEIPPR